MALINQITLRAAKGSQLTHQEMDNNFSLLANAGNNPGFVGMFAGTLASLPPGWLECAGQSLSTAAYPDTFSAIGYTYGGSGASFNLPDYRGYFLRHVDGGSGNDPHAATRTDRGDGIGGDVVGSKQEDTIQNITGTLGNGREAGTISTGAFANANATAAPGDLGGAGVKAIWTFDASRVVRTSTETKPKNIGIYFVMRVDA